MKETQGLSDWQITVYKDFHVGDLVEVKHKVGSGKMIKNTGDYHLGIVERERFGKLVCYEIKGSQHGKEMVYYCSLKIKDAILHDRHLRKISSLEEWEKIQKERIEEMEL